MTVLIILANILASIVIVGFTALGDCQTREHGRKFSPTLGKWNGTSLAHEMCFTLCEVAE